jgi:hypothetical protein
VVIGGLNGMEILSPPFPLKQAIDTTARLPVAMPSIRSSRELNCSITLAIPSKSGS